MKMKQEIITAIVNELMIHGKIDLLPVDGEINKRLSKIKFISCPDCNSKNTKIEADVNVERWIGTEKFIMKYFAVIVMPTYMMVRA
jgi:hypothetical protein